MLMANVNNITILGNLTRDPELRFTPSGSAVVNLGVAVNRRWQNSLGEWEEDVSFLDVTVWKRLAENCAESLKKGDRVLIDGRLQMKTWETNDGQTRNKIEIVAKVVAPSLEWATAEITKNLKEDIDEEYEDEIPF
jgi:single-strand DNA-binding protein